jgi:hypothetical protein
MTKFKKEYLPYAILSMLAIGFVLCCFQACKKVDEISITSKEAIIAEYQKKMLQEKHDTLTIREYIYLDRWHDSKVITKEVIKEVYIDAPDTCSPYIQKIEKAFEIERKAAQIVRVNDSTNITTLLQIAIQDSILINKAKEDLKASHDTIQKAKKKQPFKNAVAVVKGALFGAAIVEVINVVK